MMIAIRLDAGPLPDGRPRKLTLLLDQEGRQHDVLGAWPGPGEGYALGPILRITDEEYYFLLGIATGTGA